MASTVNTAFAEFLKTSVRLDPDQTAKARSSRDNLITTINKFSEDADFFTLHDIGHLKFGSFARKTKIRPLDDIDLMICLSAEGRTYSHYGNTYYVHGLEKDSGLFSEGSSNLNSTKTINRFIKKLGSVNDYSKAEMHKNQEAATLKLKSYDWTFDIVPCWHMDIDKYLIPDGSGNWKVTDPRIDNKRTTDINQQHKGNLLDVIRIMKYWNYHSNSYTIGSYLLECMILSVYENKPEKENYWIDLEFMGLLYELSYKIRSSVNDPKGIQGDLNYFSSDTRIKISTALSSAYKLACDARQSEADGDQKAAIEKWGKVFGYAFPDYS